MNADKRRSKPNVLSAFIRVHLRLILCLVAASAFAQTPRKIYEITGPGTTSPLAGQTVSVTAVVTAIRSATTSGNGFYLESLPADRDADPNTSEGLLVFIGSGAMPACAAVGNLIALAGTVADFVPVGEPTGSAPLTELAGVTNCQVLGTNMLGHLPPPVTIDSSNPLVIGGSASQARKWLGMRVAMPNAVVVGPSIGALAEPLAQSVVTGEFFVTLPGVPRPQRAPGLLATRLPADAAATVPLWNGSPESLRVNITQLAPAGVPYEVAAGAVVTGLSGVMEFHTGEGQYQLFTNAAGAGTPIPASPMNAIPVPIPQPGDLTIGSFNMERFYNNRDEGNGAVLLTAAAYQGRLNKASLAIRNVMRMPDILGLEEIEGKRNTAGAIDPRVIEDLAAKVNADAVAAGQGNPNYSWCSAPTNDPGAISLAVMFKPAKVQMSECLVYGGATRYSEPDGGNNLLNDRPPLTIKATATASGSDSGIPVRLVVNHLRSIGGVDTPGVSNGDQVRTKRNQQAIFLAKLITGTSGEQSTNWNALDNLVLVGDFNAFQFNDGYGDLMNCIAGQPPPANTQYFTAAQLRVDAPCGPLVSPPLHLLTQENPAGYYSYSFDGSTSTLDHVLINANLKPRFRQLFYARNNADFPDGPTYRNDFNRPERVSDHDMPVLYLKLPVEVTSRTRLNVSQPAFNRRPGRHTEYISVTNTGTAPLTGPVYVFFHDLPSGVKLTDMDAANGVPYAQIDLATPLAPGETSGKVAVRFTNASNVRIGYTTRRFDGTY
jgi:predicted extracellular nuclease